MYVLFLTLSFSLAPDQTVEQYCLLICNFPPSQHSCVESMKYGGKTHEQLSKVMVEVSGLSHVHHVHVRVCTRYCEDYQILMHEFTTEKPQHNTSPKTFPLYVVYNAHVHVCVHAYYVYSTYTHTHTLYMCILQRNLKVSVIAPRNLIHFKKIFERVRTPYKTCLCSSALPAIYTVHACAHSGVLQ